jgi:hypothetical protein
VAVEVDVVGVDVVGVELADGPGGEYVGLLPTGVVYPTG